MKNLIETLSNIKKKTGKGKIDSFSYVSLRTCGMRSTNETLIEAREKDALISYYTILYRDENDEKRLEKEVECSLETALTLLNGVDLISWDGFDGPHPRGVLDGTMFTLRAKVNGDREIRAKGSQNFPKHYREFTDAIFRLLSGEKEA